MFQERAKGSLSVDKLKGTISDNTEITETDQTKPTHLLMSCHPGYIRQSGLFLYLIMSYLVGHYYIKHPASCHFHQFSQTI